MFLNHAVFLRLFANWTQVIQELDDASSSERKASVNKRKFLLLYWFRQELI
jgi:hypothetical protein